MSKITHELEQGSDSWHAYRLEHFGASEAAAMLGISKHCSRSELLQRKATGIEPEISPSLQFVFDRGHATEIGGREMAEKIIGQPLYPVTMSEGKLSASCDGLTLTEDIAFEHKQHNAALADAIRAGALPAEHQPQCQQVMMVTGAEKLLFMVSDGTPDNCAHMWVEPDTEWRRTITQGWTQFAIDLAAYEHVEAVAAPVAAPIKDLPAIIITATGSLSVETNFTQWEIELRDFIARIPEKPSTDQEFADCKAALVAFKKAEAALDDEESRVLTMVPSVDDMRRHKKLLRDLSSTTRLALEKLVVGRDLAVKNEIIQIGRDKFDEHIKALNNRLGGQYMPSMNWPFAEAIKKQQSYDKMRDKVSAALANAKVAANEIADLIDLNRKSLIVTEDELGAKLDHIFLFPDFAAVCTKSEDDFRNLVNARVHEAEKRLEADRMAAEAKTAAAIAAAVEAERMAEAKRVADVQVKAREESDRITKEAARADAQAKVQAATDQRGKADAGVGLDVSGRAQPDVAITPPTSGRPVFVDERRVDDFLALLPMTQLEKNTVRFAIVGWEKYRMACEIGAAA